MNATSDGGRVGIFSRQGLLSSLILVLVVWLGNFYKSSQFSLYSDDMSYLGHIFEYANTIQAYLNSVMSVNGARPIQYGLVDLTGAAISWGGSFAAAYVFLFLITAASVLLTWWALTRRFANAAALTATIIFAISPLLSIRPFLNGIASPVALIFLMSAAILYVSGWRILSYLVSILILLSYELAFPLFILLPVLLRPIRRRSDLYQLIGHAGICILLLVGYAVFDATLGIPNVQSTIAEQKPLELGWGIVRATSLSFGYAVSGSVDIPLWLSRIGPVTDASVWAILAFVGFAIFLQSLMRQPVVWCENRAETAQTIAVLLLMVALGYALVYFPSPDGAVSVFDRPSRIHSVAALPVSILTAWAITAGLASARRRLVRAGAIGLAAGYLALMFAFSISHQDEFAREADRQRLIILQLLADHPMMDRQATFIIQEPPLDWRHYPSIDYDDKHSLFYLMPDMFDLSGGTAERSGPGIRLIQGNAWTHNLIPGTDGQLMWQPAIYPPKPERVGHVWVYDISADGVLTPVRGPLLVAGRDILHEGPDTPEGAIDLRAARKLPLYYLLLGRYGAVADSILQNASRPSSAPEALGPR